MARLRASVTTEGEIALTAATAKTILQLLAPTNQRFALLGFGVFFDGTSGSAAPVEVEILRQSTAGTMSAATEVLDSNLGAETIQVVAQKTATAEPVAGDVLRRYEVHPQSGYERVFGPDDELVVKGGDRVGLRCTAPAAVNVTGYMSWEE